MKGCKSFLTRLTVMGATVSLVFEKLVGRMSLCELGKLLVRTRDIVPYCFREALKWTRSRSNHSFRFSGVHVVMFIEVKTKRERANNEGWDNECSSAALLS